MQEKMPMKKKITKTGKFTRIHISCVCAPHFHDEKSEEIDLLKDGQSTASIRYTVSDEEKKNKNKCV